jgi:hypothetical protein
MKNLKGINYILVLYLVIVSTTQLTSQSLDKLKGQKPVTIGGFISTNQVLNQIPTDSASIINYNSFYTGSLNFNIYGVSVPFTFIYTNQQGNFSHPFNQFGLHPSYKWIRSHIGYASMSLSPYTMSGHLFLGAGVELDPPGILRASAFYGRLRKEVPYDSTNLQQVPGYKRMGYGLKIGIEKEGDFIDLVLFKAHDVVNSVDLIPESYQILPEENVAMSVLAGKTLFKNLKITGEFASSLLTKDSQTETSGEQAELTKPVSWFLPSKTSTINRNALKANLTYSQQRYSIGAGYERVEPDYRTLGAYYFNNNLENMTLNFTVNFFQNKLSFAGNGGLQRDNLDNSKMNNNKRVVGSGSINVVPSEKLNINASYSNFASYTNVKSAFDYINQTTPYENWDTLNYRQISQNVNTAISYQLSGNDKQNQSVSMNLTWQTSDNQQGTMVTDKSDFYNASASYILSLIPSNFNVSASCSYNYNETSDSTNNYTWGPNVNLSKLFFGKSLKTNLSCGYNTSTTNNINTGDTWNLRCGAAYTLKKQHNFNLTFLYQLRNSRGENIETRSYSTNTLTFAYVYNFQIIKQKEKKNEEL